MLVDRTRDSGYWRDVGTIDAYYETSMELLSVDPVFNLYGDRWPASHIPETAASESVRAWGPYPESLVSDGCIISGGTVWNSILSPAVIVERDSFRRAVDNF